MADLNSLFQNLGPTGGALMSGLNMGQDLVSAAQQDEMRKAQMDEIMQRVANQKEMAPLELKAKQQAIDAAATKAKQEQFDYNLDALGRALPQLKALKGPARTAGFEQILSREGVTLDDADRQHFANTNPDTLLAELESRHKAHMTSRPAYQQAIDVAREHSRSAENVANINAKSRAEAVAAKSAKTASTIDQQASAGKLTYEKAAVAFNIMAMNEEDPAKQQQYQTKAAQYEQLAAKLRSAGNAGKVDVGAATNLPTTEYTPVLVPGATPPANPTSPKLPQGWTLKP